MRNFSGLVQEGKHKKNRKCWQGIESFEVVDFRHFGRINHQSWGHTLQGVLPTQTTRLLHGHTLLLISPHTHDGQCHAPHPETIKITVIITIWSSRVCMRERERERLDCVCVHCRSRLLVTQPAFSLRNELRAYRPISGQGWDHITHYTGGTARPQPLVCVCV